MFNIVIKETKEFLRDRMNMFFFMIFPVLLVFLLGNLLSSMDKAEETIGEVKLQYQINTDNPYLISSINSFIDSAGEEGSLIFEETKDLDESKSLASKDKIAAVVVFSGDPLEITIYEGSNHIRNRAISAIFQSYIQTHQTISSVLRTNPAAVNEISFEQGSHIEQKDLGVNRRMIDYYAVSMIAMIAFMSMMGGAGAFVGERQNKTINRLILAPQNRVYIFLQKILGMVPQVILQISVMMLICVFVFKANYCVTLQDNIYLFFMFAVVTLSMISVGAVIGIVIKANPVVVLMPILWIMMFFGGTYSKEVNISGFTDVMPVYQIQQAAFDLAIFGRYDKVNQVILGCLIVMIIALALGAFLFSRKEEER